MDALSGSWIYILIIALLLIFQGILRAAEAGLDMADIGKIRDKLEDDPNNQKLAAILFFSKKPSRYHYAYIVCSTFVIAPAFLLFNFALPECRFLIRILVNILFLLLFYAFGNIFPSKLAMQKSNRYAERYVGLQRFLYYVSLPLVKILLVIVNLFLILLRKDTDVDDVPFTEEKVLYMLDQGQESGDIKEGGRKMIGNIFAFDDLVAREIMTPRTDVFMIDLEDDREEYFEELMELRHSRIPVCEGDADNIIGVLHIKDYLMKAAQDGFDAVRIRDILRDPYFVPETKNVDSLFVELQKTKQHIALLIDEYGGFSGLVSVEDIIEQIVGDIDDEFDQSERIIEKLSDEEYLVDGNVYLDDLEEETDIELESESSETVGGFLFDLMGEIPKEQSDETYEDISYENYLFHIVSIKDRRIERVRIKILEENTSESEKNGDL